MNALKFLANYNLSYSDFIINYILVTSKGFKLNKFKDNFTWDYTKNNLANIYLYKAIKANTNIRDFRLIRQILKEVLIKKSHVPEKVE